MIGTQQARWTKVFGVKGEHGVFRYNESGDLALADQSGRGPDHTEDGPLWVDTRMPLELYLTSSGRLGVSIPVLVGPRFKGRPSKGAGRESHTVGVPAIAQYLLTHVPGLKITLGPSLRGSAGLLIQAGQAELDRLAGLEAR